MFERKSNNFQLDEQTGKTEVDLILQSQLALGSLLQQHLFGNNCDVIRAHYGLNTLEGSEMPAVCFINISCG